MTIGTLCCSLGATVQAQTVGPEVSPADHFDVSGPLRDQPTGSDRSNDIHHDRPLRLFKVTCVDKHTPDAVLQGTPGNSAPAASGVGFAGLGNAAYGFVVTSAPPDTNGAVGDTQYVQWVSQSFAVFDKATGSPVQGRVSGNALWAGFGGGCEANSEGDPIVQFDKAAHRLVMTQFSVSTTPYLQCVAVPLTADTTGGYYRYSFQQPDFNDCPKLGVWPDA